MREDTVDGVWGGNVYRMPTLDDDQGANYEGKV